MNDVGELGEYIGRECLPDIVSLDGFRREPRGLCAPFRPEMRQDPGEERDAGRSVNALVERLESRDERQPKMPSGAKEPSHSHPDLRGVRKTLQSFPGNRLSTDEMPSRKFCLNQRNMRIDSLLLGMGPLRPGAVPRALQNGLR